MRITITYPPLPSKRGSPLLSQNRQFQWFNQPTYIYPLVPASAATLLKKQGYQVSWLDGIAEKLSYQQWLKKILKLKPNLIMMETKTPVIKKHWRIINQVKKKMEVKIVLVGDHVTALPEESFIHSQVDYVLTGGDYDFLLLNLAEHLTKGSKLEAGIYYRANDKAKKLIKQPAQKQSERFKSPVQKQITAKIKNTGRFKLNHDLNQLPIIDRDLSQWQLYAYQNGNYKYKPGAYIMAARDCWWRKNGGCSFCAWAGLYPKHRQRTVNDVLNEIGHLIKKYRVKEIMDDSGTFPVGKWLTDFCKGMIKRNFNKKISFSCNMRFGVLKEKDYQLMAKAGFRLLLFGLESANQKTLDCLNKGIKVKEIENELKLIQKINQKNKGQLESHLTCMLGYPWESKNDIHKTINFIKDIFKKGLLDSLQASIIIPYPGTKLFAQAQKNNWLKTENWADYDMKKTVLKTKLTDAEIFKLTQEFYAASLTPKFVWKKIKKIRTKDDLLFLLNAARKLTGRILDFDI
ncbi:MAG: radical SAM protein [Candidatus Woesebacteria bacterium]|jgi:radical SAM superfamily enzyme YgiQ (UPF0313 family)